MSTCLVHLLVLWSFYAKTSERQSRRRKRPSCRGNGSFSFINARQFMARIGKSTQGACSVYGVGVIRPQVPRRFAVVSEVLL